MGLLVMMTMMMSMMMLMTVSIDDGGVQWPIAMIVSLNVLMIIMI